MSGPNTSYDPVQVTPLNAASVDAMVTEALAAFAAATSVAELKQARLAHAGERSPIALANREIGALPPQARKEAGVRVGRARRVVARGLRQLRDVVRVVGPAPAELVRRVRDVGVVGLPGGVLDGLVVLGLYARPLRAVERAQRGAGVAAVRVEAVLAIAAHRAVSRAAVTRRSDRP